ncbi:TPA: transcriptional regulator [Escherichia coli]|uniref:transcriptional regulator n=1 Tax=Escherichia coli TaxID=562 RepID=UPI000E1CACBF|nr:transcriptional regulator [Escherichia coli]
MAWFFFARDLNIEIRSEVIYHCGFNVNMCAKFLAFWDYFNNNYFKRYSTKNYYYFDYVYDHNAHRDIDSIVDGLMLNFILSPVQEIKDALMLIRMTESYHLVLYLLKSIDRDECVKIKNLTEGYGVSEAYFRKLCKKALGSKVKEELSLWRLVNGLLDVFLHKETITSAAMKNGYASTSHFSTEIKNQLGFSARELTNIFFLVNKKNGTI